MTRRFEWADLSPSQRLVAARISFLDSLFLWLQIGASVLGLVFLVVAAGLAGEPGGREVSVAGGVGSIGLLAALVTLLGHVGVLVRLRVSRSVPDDGVLNPGYYGSQIAAADPDDAAHGIEPGTLVGTVAALEPPFEGPGGHQCVAAISVHSRASRRNRWSTFWVEMPEQRVAVSVLPDVLETVRASSWRREAAVPRWFRGRRLRPDLVPGEDPDWICVRVGDLIAISSPRLQWDPPRSRGRTAVPEPDDPHDGDSGEAAHSGGVVQPPATVPAALNSNPYRDSQRAAVRLRGVTPDEAIHLQVVSREWTPRLQRRARIVRAFLGVVGALGWIALLVSVLAPGDALALGRIFAVLVGLGFVVVGLGATVAELGWWQASAKPVEPPWGPVEVVTREHVQRGSADGNRADRR